MQRHVLKLLLTLMLVLLTSCAAVTREALHGFSFDGWLDQWASGVDLLAYSYGDRYHMVRRSVPPDRESLGMSAGVYGVMPVGDFIYVKWRDKASRKVYEVNVSLIGKLPVDMSGHTLTFVIIKNQLHVYLMTDKVNFKGYKDLPTYLSRAFVGYEIYSGSAT